MQRLVEYADELVTSVGSRPGASNGEHQAAELIAANLEDLGLDTWIQEFSSARGVGWVRVLYYMIGVVAAELLFIMPGLSVLSFVLALIAFVLLALDIIGKNPLYNLIGKGESQNVIARYSPDGADPRRKVVIVAHYDSGRSLLQCAPPVAPFYIIVRKAVRICVVALAAVALLSLFPFPEMVSLFLSIVAVIIGILLLIAAIVEVINLFMPFNQGANSNASGVAAMMGVAETLVGVRDDAGLDTGQAERAQAAVNTQGLAAGGRAGRGAKRSTRSSSRGEAPSYDENDEMESGKQPRRGAGAIAGIGGAAGSLFSKAKGLVSGGTDNKRTEDYYEEYPSDDAPVQASRSQRIRSGKPVSRGVSASQASVERIQRSELSEAAATVRAQQGTADLGAETIAAARSASPAGASGQAQAQAPEAASQRTTSTNAAGPTRISTGMPTSNPAIRKRPPLAEQQELERSVTTSAASQSSSSGASSEDGMPAWFVNAKKAAKKEAPVSQPVADKDVKVARSRYADVPLEYTPKPKTEAQPAVTAAPAAASSVAEGAAASRASAEASRAQEQQAQTQVQGQQAEQAEQTAPVGGQRQPETSTRSEPEQDQRTAVEGREQRQAEQGHVRARDPQTTEQASEAPAQPEQTEDAAAAKAQSSASQVPPTTLNADFSGIDRLASDPLPTPSPRNRPAERTSFSGGAAAQTPSIPENDRLSNLPKLSLGNSGSIPTQQAAFDQEILFDEEELLGTGRVSNTGSFAPLGATGVMKPVGEELLQYHEGNEQDLYIQDADESDTGSIRTGSRGERGAPSIMEIPQSRTKSFFGGLGDRLSGGRKSETLDSSPATWLGVEEDFDARKEGSQIGGWENFSEEDDDNWKGGAYGGESFEEDEQALAQFSSVLVDKEVWIVALGSHENKNAGIKSLLHEYERELKSALFINLDSVGVGQLCYTMAEGVFRPKGTDHRLQGLVKSAAQALGVDIAPTGFRAYNTDAAAALSEGARAISLIGLDGNLPTGWRWSDDCLDILEEDNLDAVADVVVEVIKSV